MFLFVDYKLDRTFLSIVNLHLVSCVIKVNDHDGLSQNPPSAKTQTDLLLSSRSYDDERSLGLTGINWVFNLIFIFKKHLGVFFICFIP